MDIYTFLFKNINKKTLINFEGENFYLKYYNKQTEVIYEIYEFATVTINREKFYSSVDTLPMEYNQNLFEKFLNLVDIINKYNYTNYCYLEDHLKFKRIDFMTVNTLSGMENPYLNDNFKILQYNFPTTDNVDLLKSNSYYYSKFFKENIENIIILTPRKFLSMLKKIYKENYETKPYIKNLEELSKFNMSMKDFILEKANLNQLSCFKFYYSLMTKILLDMYLLPKKYVKFY